jgi:hypothetical protein
VARAGDEPRPEAGLVDVAVLDMHHGFPNLGHASIVDTILGLGREEAIAAGIPSVRLRVVSYDVRAGLAVPAGDPERFALVVGTGGPGALDPRENDGSSPYSQGVAEDPSWEAPLWRFFDKVIAGRTSLVGICHTFGLLARWSGTGHPEARSAAKGGKSTGVVSNFLTDAARKHPWFSGLYRASLGRRIEVLDSRLYDILPTGRNGFSVLAHEAAPDGESEGEAMTMVEYARAEDGEGPRVWGVNHHPEIGDIGQQRDRLGRLAASGTVSAAWVEERGRALDAWSASHTAERRLLITASFTFEQPVRRILAQALRSAA